MIHTGYIGTAPDGAPTHSFHEPPRCWCCMNHVLDLSPEQAREAAAVHEAGHLVIDLRVGIHVIDVRLTPEQAQRPCGPVLGVGGHTQIGRVSARPQDFLAMLAAGELAEQRWLRESGLRTADRAWAVEQGARDDTDRAVAALREHWPGPALDENGYRQLYWRDRPAAQSIVDDNWDRVLNVAGLLARRGYLTGDQAAGLASLPNPAEPPAS